MSPNKKAARIEQAANDQMGKVRKGEKNEEDQDF